MGSVTRTLDAEKLVAELEQQKTHRKETFTLESVRSESYHKGYEHALEDCINMFDKVLYDKQECFIFGRRTSGSFDIRHLDGTKVSSSITYKKLRLLECGKTLLIEKTV